MAVLVLFLIFGFHRVAGIPTEVTEALIPTLTPAPTLAVYADQPNRRDIFDDFTSKLDSYVGSVFTELGTAIPSYVSEGLLPNLQDLPTGSQVLSSAGISSTDLAAVPTQVLNIPGYGNYTQNGWNLRIHGNVYKQPSIDNETVDDLTNFFLIDTSVEELPPEQASQARNLTRQIFVVQQGDQNVTMDLTPSPQSGGGGATPAGGYETFTLPDPTTDQGDFDVFVPISADGLQPGTGELPAQQVSLYAQGTDTGNATSYLVSNQGLTVVSDIDDILRVTQIYQPKEGLLNTFARPFRPWLNMPEIYQNWSTSLPNLHFHYLTTTPEQGTRPYMQHIYSNYPGGSFDTRPLNFSDVSATLSIRKYLLDRIFQTYPDRKFILVADTSNGDVMRDYPKMATEYPGQVQCIFLRNTSATDPTDKFPYNTEGFRDLNTMKYMFFNVPDDLRNLDIVDGQCRNATVPQDVTFGYQGLPFGLDQGDGDSGNGSNSAAISASIRGGWICGWKGLMMILAMTVSTCIW